MAGIDVKSEELLPAPEKMEVESATLDSVEVANNESNCFDLKSTGVSTSTADTAHLQAKGKDAEGRTTENTSNAGGELEQLGQTKSRNSSIDELIYGSTTTNEASDGTEINEATTSAGASHCSGGMSSELPSSETATIVVAGRPKSGKSSALNKIFDLNLTTKLSPTAVTEVVTTSKATKGNFTLTIIDTPGLGGIHHLSEDVSERMAEAIGRAEYTLFYCMSIAPSSTLTLADKTIVKNLIKVGSRLKHKVWKKCILLMTFSDRACNEFESRKEYVEYVEEHASAFQSLLKKEFGPLGPAPPEVKTIFSYKTIEELQKREKISEIIAIPVMKEKKSSKYDILPGFLGCERDWTDIVFMEFIKTTSVEKRSGLWAFKEYLPQNKALAGAAIGASVGSVVGIFGGPLMPLGVGIGAGVGLLAGGATSLTIKAASTTKNYFSKHRTVANLADTVEDENGVEMEQDGQSNEQKTKFKKMEEDEKDD